MGEALVLPRLHITLFCSYKLVLRLCQIKVSLTEPFFAKAPAGKERDILDLDLKKEKRGREAQTRLSAGREAGLETRSRTSTISHMISANKLIICKTSKQFVIVVRLCNAGTC